MASKPPVPWVDFWLRTFSRLQDWDWVAIVTCVVLAVFIWVFNALNKSYTTRYDYPVQFQMKAEDVVAVVPPPKTISVEITGSGWSLLRRYLNIDYDPLPVLVENPQTNSIATRSLRNRLAAHARDLTISSFADDSIYFRYEPLTSKVVKIHVGRSDPPLGQGFRLDSDIRISPAEVVFRGARSLIDSLPNVLGVEFRKKSIEGNFSEQLFLDYPSHHLLIPEQNVVKVEFKVAQYVQKNRLVSVTPRNFPPDSSVILTQSEGIVQFYVRKEFEYRADQEPILIWVDYNNINKADSTIKPAVILSEDLLDPVISPSKFKVKYVKDWNNRRNRSR